MQHPGKPGLHLFLCLDLPLGPASLKAEVAWAESGGLFGGSSSLRGDTGFVFLWSSSSVPGPGSISPQAWVTLGSSGLCDAAVGEAEQK